ncbi:MAG: ABC transporter permease, partial [Ekhidna sp.]|nr:ABC transporter permease [Ekhidna sp.]
MSNKSTLFLNTLGLSIGISACVLAYLHVAYELSYDTHYSNKSQLHRIVVGNMETGEGWVKVAAPIPPKLKKDIPEIVEFARLTEYSYDKKVAVSYENITYTENQVYLADQSIYEMLDIKLLNGSIDSKLPNNSVLISDFAARKVFKDKDPMGEVLTINSDKKYQVVGVFKSLPENGHLQMDYIVPFENLEEVLPYASLNGNWRQFNYFAYVQLETNADVSNVIRKIKSTVVEFGDDQEMRFEQLTLQPI